LSGARTRWGSCNSHGDIRLSWRLIQAPISQIDYVVVHELAHIRELNHSPRFWAIVEETLPHYAAAQRALKTGGARYSSFLTCERAFRRNTMRILHTMIRVGDLDKSIVFYTDVLGMKLLAPQGLPGR